MLNIIINLNKLKIIQNFKNLINNINNNIELNKIHYIMIYYICDIRYYCNKNNFISYITELEIIHEKLLNDYGNITEIKKDLIDTLNEIINSF